jgi:hypothetical protein
MDTNKHELKNQSVAGMISDGAGFYLCPLVFIRG